MNNLYDPFLIIKCLYSRITIRKINLNFLLTINWFKKFSVFLMVVVMSFFISRSFVFLFQTFLNQNFLLLNDSIYPILIWYFAKLFAKLLWVCQHHHIVFHLLLVSLLSVFVVHSNCVQKFIFWMSLFTSSKLAFLIVLIFFLTHSRYRWAFINDDVLFDSPKYEGTSVKLILSSLLHTKLIFWQKQYQYDLLTNSQQIL
jgi:hypothetical protein